MKGLYRGIPLAVLAATAHAQVQGIGGSGGTDIGNGAAIPTENSVSSSVAEEYTDDHSLEFEHEVHVYPKGQGHDHHKRTAGFPGDDSAIGGPGGVDIGNSADIPTLNEFSSAYSASYTDDHSVDVDKTTIIKPADHEHGHWRRGKTSVIDGPGGVDIGNSADIPTLNEFSSAYSASYTDDHSVDVDKTTIIKPGDHEHGHWRRGYTSVSDGPGGVDIGNSVDIPTLNEFSSEYSESYTDNHSVDVDKTTIVKPGDHGHRRRGHTSVIGGPGGVDVGSSGFFPTVNKFSSSYTGYYKDDHSVDIDKTTIIKAHHDEHPALGFHHPMHEARDDGPTVIGGPHGVDIGNSADIPTLNSFTSTFDGTYTDDHSVDIDKTLIVKPNHKARAQRQEDTTVSGGPDGFDSGNAFGAATVNSVDTQTAESLNDDHSVKIESHQVITPGDHEHHGKPRPHYEGHGDEQHSDEDSHSEPQPDYEDHGDEQHSDEDSHSEPQPDYEDHGDEQHSDEDSQSKPQPDYEDHGDEQHSDEDSYSEPQPDYEDHGDEEHSDENSHSEPQPDYEDHGDEQHSDEDSHSELQPPTPVPQPECTKFHEVVQTVTRTHTAVAVETQTAHPQYPQEDSHQNSWAETPSNGNGWEQAPANPQSDSGSWSSDSQTPSQSSSEQSPGWEQASANPQSDSGSWSSDSQTPNKPTSEEYPGKSSNEQNPSQSTSEQSPGWEQASANPQSDSGSWSSDSQTPNKPTSEEYPGESSNEQTPSQSSSEQSPGWEQASANPQSDSGSWSSDSQTPNKPTSEEYPGKSSNEQNPSQSTSEQSPGWEQASANPQSDSGSWSSDSQTPNKPTSEQYPGESSNEQTPSQSSSEQYPGESSNEQDPSQSSNEQYPGESSNEQTPSQYSSEQYPGESSNEQDPSQSSNEQYPDQSTDEEDSYPEAAATPLYHGSQAAEAQPSPTGAYHAPQAAASGPLASTFAVIPVHVPSGTPSAHGSVVIAASSTPCASSAFLAVPTGASAEENSRDSPSSHGAVEFTGSAGRFASATSAFTVLAGVFAVLAFAL